MTNNNTDGAVISVFSPTKFCALSEPCLCLQSFEQAVFFFFFFVWNALLPLGSCDLQKLDVTFQEPPEKSILDCISCLIVSAGFCSLNSTVHPEDWAFSPFSTITEENWNTGSVVRAEELHLTVKRAERLALQLPTLFCFVGEYLKNILGLPKCNFLWAKLCFNCTCFTIIRKLKQPKAYVVAPGLSRLTQKIKGRWHSRKTCPSNWNFN